MRPGGRFASTLGVGPDQLSEKDLEATAVVAMPTRDVLDTLAEKVVAGELQVAIGRTYQLEQVPQAIKEFAQGSLGKFAVIIS